MHTMLSFFGRRFVRSIRVLAIGAALLAWLPVRPVYAASLVVTTTADELNNDGDCSLREAIRAANTDKAVDKCPAGAGADTVKIPSGTYTLTRAGAKEDGGEMGDIDISADLTLSGTGSGTVLDGYTLDRLIDIHAPAKVTISDMLLRRGYVGVENGGGLRNRGTLVLRRVTITGNVVDTGMGGGVWNSGKLEIFDSTVGQNSAVSDYSFSAGGGIGNEGSLSVRNTRITGNRAESGSGGGVYSTGTLEISDSTVEANRSSGAAGIQNAQNGHALLTRVSVKNNISQGDGGGVANDSWIEPASEMVIDDSIISGNRADSAGGGISSGGKLTMTRTTVSGNRATSGGGLLIANNTTIRGSTISGNSAVGSEDSWRGGHGGGIYNDQSYTSALVTVTDSTISGNTAYGDGGGFYNAAVQSTPSISLLNNVTIANNTADANNNGTGEGGGVFNSQQSLSPSIELANSIIAANRDRGNQAPDCSGELVSRRYNLIQQTAGCMISGDTTGNILGRSAGLATLASNGGRTKTHALLSGSPAIDTGNPVAPNSDVYACRSTDQRGINRPLDGNGDKIKRCDIGAYELAPRVASAFAKGQTELDLQPAPEIADPPVAPAPAEEATPAEEASPVDALQAATSSSISVTTFADELNRDGDCSLREALRAANWNERVDACPAGGTTDTIILAAGTYTLTRVGTNEEASATGDLDVTASVTIRGAGIDATTIDANALDRVLEVHGQFTKLILTDLTLRNGRLDTTSGGFPDGVGLRSRATAVIRGVAIKDNHTTTWDESGGGGIFNHGTMTLENCSISGNSIEGESVRGAGILNGGSLNISRCSISRNASSGIDSHAGGIWNSGTLSIAASTVAENQGGYFVGGIGNGGTMTVRDSTVKHNIGDQGAGIQNSGTATINSSVIIENETRSGDNPLGSAIHNWGTITIDGSLISGNAARGIYSEREMTIKNSSIIGNRGGIYHSYGKLKLSGSTISGNGAPDLGGGVYNQGGTIEATNSTISDNRAPEGGGGIANIGVGIVSLNNVTLVENRSRNQGKGAGIFNGDYAEGNRVRLRNTIVANNRDDSLQPSDCAGQLSSYGYNLIESVTGCTVGNIATGNLIGVDPQLGPLQDNGGPTKTQAPLAGSPVIDAGNTASVGSNQNACVKADQRGVSRPRDGNGDGTSRCDIGAVERRSPSSTATSDVLQDGIYVASSEEATDETTQAVPGGDSEPAP